MVRFYSEDLHLPNNSNHIFEIFSQKIFQVLPACISCADDVELAVVVVSIDSFFGILDGLVDDFGHSCTHDVRSKQSS